MFDPKHLTGASSDLVQSMVKVGRKAAELERVKLQTEIQKEKSEIRRKRLENLLKMSKEGGKGGPAKKTVKPEPEPMEDDDDNVLEDLVMTMETDKGQLSYSTLEPGGFVTKGTDRIKKCIGNICREQALAHRHAAEAADNLANLTDLVSLLILVKVISATMRPTVAIKIPEVDDMIARAEQKVEAIRQAKQKVGELKPIDEVVFAQNIPKYNPEWEHSPNGRATAYLATLVCRYMHELQQKDKKVVLSAKALETIYHTASSSIGKLISGKQYLGGAALEQLRDKVEAEGKELPFKKKKKLPLRSSGLAKTSGTALKD